MNINDCIEFATKKLSDKTLINGEPYINHALRVAIYLKYNGYDIKYQIAGLFHFLLEITDTTQDDILKYSDKDVLDVVQLLTPKTSLSEGEYINLILNDPTAKAVKNASIIDYLDSIKELDVKIISEYLEKTKKLYYGKFSEELDKMYTELEKYLVDKTTYSYTIDSSWDNGPVYRTNKLGEAWKYNFSTKQWDNCDPYFWLDMEHNATLLTEEEAYQILEENE